MSDCNPILQKEFVMLETLDEFRNEYHRALYCYSESNYSDYYLDYLSNLSKVYPEFYSVVRKEIIDLGVANV